MADIPVWKYGKGDITLVLVHGGPSLSRYMQTLGNLLKEKYSIIEYQQRGTPESPAESVSLKFLTEELKVILKVCPENRILIGHSWGATLVNLFLKEQDEKAIFIDPAPLTSEDAKKFSENLHSRMPKELRAELEELKDMQKRLELISPYYHLIPETDKKLGNLLWNYQSFCLIMDEVWDMIDAGKLSLLSGVPVIHGKHDPTPYLSHAHLIDNAGHFPWLENEKEFLKSLESLILSI